LEISRLASAKLESAQKENFWTPRQPENTSHLLHRIRLVTASLADGTTIALPGTGEHLGNPDGRKNKMQFGVKLALLTVALAGIAIVGPEFSLIRSAIRQSRNVATDSNAIRQSVVKVHTDHGVITLPGTADSWEQVEDAVFVADSIADVQMVNNEIPWRIHYE
jgi:hypothetical protein